MDLVGSFNSSYKIINDFFSEKRLPSGLTPSTSLQVDSHTQWIDNAKKKSPSPSSVETETSTENAGVTHANF